MALGGRVGLQYIGEKLISFQEWPANTKKLADIVYKQVFKNIISRVRPQ